MAITPQSNNHTYLLGISKMSRQELLSELVRKLEQRENAEQELADIIYNYRETLTRIIGLTEHCQKVSPPNTNLWAHVLMEVLSGIEKLAREALPPKEKS